MAPLTKTDDSARDAPINGRMHAVFNILIPFCLFVVLAILATGIYALMRGGEFGRRWSNKLMQMRVVAQGLAILVLLAAFWWSRHGGS
jgi:hypothetical protein